jgi:hypothetical protein
MTPDELDHAYTRLCQTMERVGEPATPRLLAMMTLALMARQADGAPVLDLIKQVEAACLLENT